MKLASFLGSLLLVTAAGCTALNIYSPAFTSAHDATLAAMNETSIRIAMYAEKHGHLPKRLNDLPVRKERPNRTTDGWNHPLEYKVDSEKEITLKSLGGDGKRGGTDAAADISVRYELVAGAMMERHSTAER